MPSRSDIAVVVIARDRPAHLDLVLRGLAAQSEPPAEVVVVDDGSNPGLGPVAHRHAAALVRRDGHGRAAARNAGAAGTTSPILLFLDDDLALGAHLVSGHRGAHAARPGPAAVHGPVADLPRVAARVEAAVAAGGPDLADLFAAVRNPDQRAVSNSLERFLAERAAGLHPGVAPWLGFVGANTSVPREAFDAAGGFDEAFGTRWGCEDLELGARLDRRGVELVLEPGASCGHLALRSGRSWVDHKHNLQRFAEAHPDLPVGALVDLLGPTGSVPAFLAALGQAAPSGT